MMHTGARKRAKRARIACIQHGDYRAGLKLIAEGKPEPYFGMRESVSALEELFAPHEALVISLDAPAYHERQGNKLLVGHPFPNWYRYLPGLRWEMYAWPVLRELERFRPTHVLLRCGTVLGARVASFCAENRIPTLVVLANAVWAHGRLADTNRKLMQLFNDPTFTRVYNYKPTACLSMVDYGLSQDKAYPYEFGGERLPSEHAPKELIKRDDCHIVFAARMIEAKGPFDVVEAVRILRERGVPARATLFGTGDVLELVRARAAQLPEGAITLPGVVDNDTLFRTYRSAAFACVPTHPTFVEGMPMSLTEALASRTPVIASDCDVFKRSFVDGEGVRLFEAQNPTRLADVVAEVFASPDTYAELSRTTEAAFTRVYANRSFSEVIAAWAEEIAEGTRGGSRAENDSHALDDAV